jgi:hypothetical protein
MVRFDCQLLLLYSFLFVILALAISMKQYKFNWANPTSHWSLNLGDKVQRAIMLNLIAINNSEAEFSQKHSGRQDTSQLVRQTDNVFFLLNLHSDFFFLLV